MGPALSPDWILHLTKNGDEVPLPWSSHQKPEDLLSCSLDTGQSLTSLSDTSGLLFFYFFLKYLFIYSFIWENERERGSKHREGQREALAESLLSSELPLQGSIWSLISWPCDHDLRPWPEPKPSIQCIMNCATRGPHIRPFKNLALPPKVSASPHKIVWILSGHWAFAYTVLFAFSLHFLLRC